MKRPQQSSRRSAPPTIERKTVSVLLLYLRLFQGAPLGDVVADGNAIIDKMDLPSGVSIQISGSYGTNRIHSPTWGTLAVLIVILVFTL